MIFCWGRWRWRGSPTRSRPSRPCWACWTCTGVSSRRTRWAARRASPGKWSSKAASTCWPSPQSSLKGNQKRLWEYAAGLFAQAQTTGGDNLGDDARLSGWSTGAEKGHGRIETRHYRLIVPATGQARGSQRGGASARAPGNWLDPGGRWAGLRGVGMVQSERRTGGQVTTEVRYYLTSLSDVRAFGRAVRAHWGIENRLHWVLDTAFAEDGCRVRKDHAPQNLATLRRLALKLLRQGKTDRSGLKTRRLRAAWDAEFLLQVLAGTKD